MVAPLGWPGGNKTPKKKTRRDERRRRVEVLKDD
jgi:hypothetical protein